MWYNNLVDKYYFQTSFQSHISLQHIGFYVKFVSPSSTFIMLPHNSHAVIFNHNPVPIF